MKKTVLTNVEKFYIANNLSLDIDVLSKDIDKPVDLIKEYVSEVKATLSVDTKHVTNAKKADISSMFAKKRGAVIMTEGASQHGDKQSGNKRKDDTGYIHKIK